MFSRHVLDWGSAEINERFAMQTTPNVSFEIYKQRLKSTFVPLILLVLCVLVISLRLKPNVPTDLLFETFSAVIQTFVSVMALLGMVGVFKLEILNSKINNLAESAKRLLVYFRGPPGQYLLPEDVLEEGERIIGKNHPGSEGKVTRLKTVVAKLRNFYTTAKEIKTCLLDFLIFTSLAIGLTIIFLATTPLISKYYLGIPTLVLVVILSIASLLSTIGLIQSIL